MKRNYIQYARNVILIFFVAGIALTGYGAYQYYTSDQRINEIESERREVEDQLRSVDPDLLRGVNPAPIAGRDIQLRRELNEKYSRRDEATKMVGFGIAIFGVAWLIRDLLKSRFAEQQSEASAEAG